MADAFAIIGVVGVAGQIIQLIAKHGMDWKDAPAETAKCLEDISLLKALLDDTDTDTLQTLSVDLKAATAASASACKDELAKLYRELTRRTTGHRVGWKRLKGAFGAKKTRDAVDDLHRRLQAINNSVSRDALVVVTKGVTGLHDAQQQTIRDNDAERILAWISPADYDSVHSDFVSRRQEGTGKWLLNSDEYRQWLVGTGKALFCPGIPGAGKTMATAIVVDDLLDRFRGDSSDGIAFVYCNFWRQSDQKPGDILTSLLKQLCQRRASLPQCVRDLFNECAERKRRPQLEELTAAFEEVILQFSQVFLAIDALDECGMEDGNRSRLLVEYTALRDVAGANIFATSRHMNDIKQKFTGSLSREIFAHPEDIRQYLDGKIPSLASFVADNIDLQEEIKTAIVDAVEGMFLLAKLHLDSLQGQRSPKQIRLILRKFRTGSDAYYYAYEDAMRRIGGQPKGQEDLAMQALAWIVCSKRPLKPLELQEALAVELDSDELDPDNVSPIEDIVSACAGLVTVDEQDEVVRLAHYTVQEYFERTMTKWFPSAEQDITQTCVAYLSLSVFDWKRMVAENPYDNFIDWRYQNPQHLLLEYASVNWGNHARMCTSQESKDVDVRRRVIRFLESTQHANTLFEGWFELQEDVYRSFRNFDDEYLTPGLHLSAIFGLDWAVSHFLRQVHPDIYDSVFYTPLAWATEFRWPSCMALLLDAGADVNLAIGETEHTVIWRAAEKGDGSMVKQLLLLSEDIDVSAACRGHTWAPLYSGISTPLGIAAARGNEAVVRVLLDDKRVSPHGLQLRGWDIHRHWWDYDMSISPLYAAAAEGHTRIVEILLDHGAPIECGSDFDLAPIAVAAEEGHLDVVELFLRRQADPNIIDIWGRTPLARASGRGCVGIFKLLLEAGADPNVICAQGMSILSHAALGGNKTLVDLLLSNERFQPELDRKDDLGGSAMFWAAVSGHDAVVDTLVARGAQRRPQEGWDLAPLHKAALGLHRELVPDILNDLAINIMLWDAGGRAPRANPEFLKDYLERFERWKLYPAFMRGSWNVEEGRRIVEGSDLPKIHMTDDGLG